MSGVSLVTLGVIITAGLSFLGMILIVLLDFNISKKAEMKNRKYY
jgi:hypothetical protein